jgi:hypothetical protein
MADRRSVRAAREVVKLTDLAPRHDIKGGSQRRVFGADPIRDDRKAGAGKTADGAAKDLPAKSSATVKGGGISRNDSVTLLRVTRRRRRRATRGGL